jgi:hypothetical protein
MIIYQIRMRSWLRLGFCVTIFSATFIISLWLSWRAETHSSTVLTDGDLMIRLMLIPSMAAALAFAFCSSAKSAASSVEAPTSAMSNSQQKPYIAQVVGVQWLNPLQRKDYPTEWQLLRIIGLAEPNKNDDMVKSEPELFLGIHPILAIASGNDGTRSFKGYFSRYVNNLISPFRDIYFSDSSYFYNAHSLKDKSTRRELAGIRVEHALPEGKLVPDEATAIIQESIVGSFDIGNPHFPKSWTRPTPPDIHLTMGGANAGFTSLARGLSYLEANPSQTVWVMNWDAPSYPPKDNQINENMVLLVLAGPDYKTERAPLAWLSHPAVTNVEDFKSDPDQPPRTVQAWKAVFGKAIRNAGKQTADIGFVIHDANKSHLNSSNRLAYLARTVTEQMPALDFMVDTFNTPSVLGNMGAGTALTNVALAIAYANHVGKSVLVAGTTEESQLTATVVAPPAVVRPINPDKPWFRARSGSHTYLAWWGARHDADLILQGYSR